MLDKQTTFPKEASNYPEIGDRQLPLYRVLHEYCIPMSLQGTHDVGKVATPPRRYRGGSETGCTSSVSPRNGLPRMCGASLLI